MVTIIAKKTLKFVLRDGKTILDTRIVRPGILTQLPDWVKNDPLFPLAEKEESITFVERPAMAAVAASPPPKPDAPPKGDTPPATGENTGQGQPPATDDPPPNDDGPPKPDEPPPAEVTNPENEPPKPDAPPKTGRGRRG